MSHQANNANEANIYAVMGSTGCGKSLWLKTTLLKKSHTRLAIWDYKREYQGYADTITESIAEAVKAMMGRNFKVAFRPSFNDKVRARQFNIFCKAVWHAKDTFCIIEELAMVTTPQRAPEGWKQLTCTGRSEGITIVGLSQRPAQVDKDFFDNCTEIHCGLLGGPRSRAVMADELDVKKEDIAALKPFEYIHKNMKTKEITQGTVKKNW
jgi:hypothetical protein